MRRALAYALGIAIVAALTLAAYTWPWTTSSPPRPQSTRAPQRPDPPSPPASHISVSASNQRLNLRLDRIVARKRIGVAMRAQGRELYAHASLARRVPTSVQKLLLSMALLDLLGPDLRIATTAAAARVQGDTVEGDLWIVGGGDPTFGGARNGMRLAPLRTTRVGSLARRIRAAGVRRIAGRIMGSTDYFLHDWYAPGWKEDFAAYEVALPSALSFDGNSYRAKHIDNPERRAAEALTRRLQSLGVRVDGKPGAGDAPAGLTEIARVESEPLLSLVTYMNLHSSNFFAEVLGKLLGAEEYGEPGTIAKGADAIASWAKAEGVSVVAHDSSGLSYANLVSADGLARLLDAAEEQAWGAALRYSLPTPGEGTLEGRLEGARIRAKTGTLSRHSALSGWVWLQRRREWAPFVILSSGLPKHRARALEDRIVRLLSASAR